MMYYMNAQISKNGLNKKESEVRKVFNFKLNTIDLSTKYNDAIEKLEPSDTHLLSSLQKSIKVWQEKIQRDQSDNTLTAEEKKQKIRNSQNRIKDIQGTISTLIGKGAKVK